MYTLLLHCGLTYVLLCAVLQVIADFEDPTSMETSSMASFDSAHNFPGGNANLPAGTTPSLTSADNEEQTPVLDRHGRCGMRQLATHVGADGVGRT